MFTDPSSGLNKPEKHVAHPSFGDNIDSSDYIRDMLKSAPALCSTDTQLLLTDRYDTTYGIFNHDTLATTRPLAVIAMHPSEDVSHGGALYGRIDQFATLQVGKFFNMSLTEFLDMPSDVCTHILEVSSQMQKTEGNVASDMLDKLEGR